MYLPNVPMGDVSVMPQPCMKSTLNSFLYHAIISGGGAEPPHIMFSILKFFLYLEKLIFLGRAAAGLVISVDLPLPLLNLLPDLERTMCPKLLNFPPVNFLKIFTWL